MSETSQRPSLSPGLPRLMRLTPRGRGAVAVLRLEGEGALDAVAPFFRRRDGDASAAVGLYEIGRVRYGRWKRADAADAAAAEDVVLCQVEPHVIEIHCHGGEEAPSAIERSLVDSRAATLVDADAEIERTFAENWRRQAFTQLQRATAPVAARILWDQFQGAWPRLLERLRSHLHELRAPDESIGQVRTLVERALGFERLGRHLVEPWRVVLAGPPNVGKSSLVNRLVGYERSIAYDEPGTTRDVLIVRSVLAGLPVEFSDTAGLRTASDAIESEGIARTREALSRADLVLLLADASGPWTPEHEATYAASPSAIVVHHKRDLVAAIPADRPAGIEVSSLSGEGVADLLTAIVSSRLVPRIPEPGEAVPIDDEQIRALRALLSACDRGVEELRRELDLLR